MNIVGLLPYVTLAALCPLREAPSLEKRSIKSFILSNNFYQALSLLRAQLAALSHGVSTFSKGYLYVVVELAAQVVLPLETARLTATHAPERSLLLVGRRPSRPSAAVS